MSEKTVEIPEIVTIRSLAELMEVSPIDVIKQLMNLGIMANINQQIDFETAVIVGSEMGVEVKLETPFVPEEEETAPQTLRQRLYEGEDPEDLKPRPPVVTVLGHVDHGKTKLLDAIRHTNVQEGEAGGITQRIGAYQVSVDGRLITFIDTPGHEAFTAMRARGAQVTDIAVLVVAADDGVMPQTREAIDHARAAQVPIIVALNKIDLPSANPERVKQQLADLDLVVDDWGGDVVCVQVSAKQHTNIEDLLENILLVAEVEELKANPDRPAVGTVIEGQVDTSRGTLATLLIQNGSLHQGDVLLVGEIYGRVRAMHDDKGRRIRRASPSEPVVVMGLSSVPTAGDIFQVVEDERTARAIAEKRAAERAERAARPVRLSLEEIFERFQAGEIKELNVILKADVQGSLEPIVDSLEDLGNEDLKIKILRHDTGNVNESDVMLAVASEAIVIGFNVTADAAARRAAEAEGVDIRLYRIIYKLIEDMDKALKGLLEPEYQDVVIGHAEVRAVFRISRMGNIAGVYVTDGVAARNGRVRVHRGAEVLFDGQLASLKRFTEDVREVQGGFECGVGVEGFGDFEEGDILEFYRKEQVT
ncbi:MAG: translation initiation factor IF-2 [Anaerolineae bacterium]|nr:MAG: translation initiation factor IF-2 [Anaerolineae bacterium]